MAAHWFKKVAVGALPWYLEEKIRVGAFATLLGLTFTEPLKGPTGTWEAMTIGDSCLFHVRGDTLRMFPPMNKLDFQRNPVLASSNMAMNTVVFESLRYRSDEWRINDKFYLMTDALAYWCVSSFVEHRKPWVTIEQQDTAVKFEAWIAKLREDQALPNDDVTLVRIDMR